MQPTTEGKTVTITLRKEILFDWKGQLIKIKNGNKRTWGIVTDTNKGTGFEDEPDVPTLTMTVKGVYRPAPKSKLIRFGKTPFSKLKMKIIPIK